MGHLNVGHLNVAALGWLPLFVFALLRAAEGSRRAMVLAPIALAMTALCEWHTAVFAVVVGGVVVAVLVVRALQRRVSWWAPGRAIMASLAGGLVLLPLIIPTAQAVAEAGRRAELGDRFAETHSANLLAFLLPQDLHPLWQPAMDAWRQAAITEALTEGRVSLGWTVLALALVGIAALRWRALPGLVVLALGMGLALGPVLHVGTEAYDVVTPYDLFERLPYVDVSRTPARFSVLAMLALAMLAAFGVRALARSLAPRVPEARTLVLAGLLVVGEFLTAPYGMTPPPDTTVAARVGQEIAALDPAGTVLTLPYRRAEQERVFHQVHHQRPIFGGFIPRDLDRPFRSNTPGFADLSLNRPFVDIFEPMVDPLAALNYFRVRYILLYRGEVRDDEPGRRLQAAIRQLLRQTAPAMTTADQALEAWRVPPREVPLAFLRTGRGWHPVERWQANSYRRWMAEEAEWHLERSVDVPVTIDFVAVSYAKPRRIEVRADDQVLGVYTIRPELMPVTLHLPAGSGTTRLTFRSLDGIDIPNEWQPNAGTRDSRALSVAMTQVHVTPGAATVASVPGSVSPDDERAGALLSARPAPAGAA
jgi:hypothetical protein